MTITAKPNVVSSGFRIVRNLRMIAREFDNPLRSLLLGLSANEVALEEERLGQLKPLDAPFRNQCLALLLALPNFNLEKAIDLAGLPEPLRTQGLTVLASAPSFDVEAVVELQRLEEPFRSQCMAWLTKDPDLGHPKLRLLQQCHPTVREQMLSLVAGVPSFSDADALRLTAFLQYRPDVPGHADTFLRDSYDRVYADDVHARAAVEWLLTSQAVTKTPGFAAAYSFKEGWLPPYPETTGYIIPTIFDAYAAFGEASFRDAAKAAAEWEIDIQMSSGAIQAGYWGNDPQRFWQDEQVPAAFNTGQVVLGWNRTFLETGEHRFLDAAIRACHYLVTCIDSEGIFRGGLSPGPTNPTRAYYTRVAYAMAWTAQLANEPAFARAARRHLEWVLTQLQPDGWLLHAGFQDDDRPLTHTMAYTAEGLLYAGEMLDDARYIDASRRHARAAAAAYEQRGFFLPAHFTSGWNSSDQFSCVPGNAQFAALWLRHGERDGDEWLVNTGLKMVDWLKQRQSLDNPHPGIRGGLPGASPIDGGYSVYSYVNWAAKYFVDAALAAARARARISDVT